MGDVVLFDSGNVPAHIAAKFGIDNSDLSANVGIGGFPHISFKGKVWHVCKGDERTLITNPDGDPRSSIEIVIIKGNPNISKVFYESGYEEGSTAKPTCYSNNGVGPAADSLKPQNTTCAACPRNVWGSRVTESGAKGKECTDSRRLAVVPSGDLENPMLLRIPAATLKDLTEYANTLNRRKVPYSAVVTRVGFDHTVAHQKLTFKPVRFLTEDEADIVADVMQRDIIQNILGLSETPAPASDVLDIPGKPPARLMEPDETPVTRPKSKIAVTEDDVEAAFGGAFGGEEVAPAPEPEVVAAKKPAPKKAAPKPVTVVEDDINQSLDDILASLDDE